MRVRCSRREFLGLVAGGAGAVACSGLPKLARSAPPTTVPLVYDEMGRLAIDVLVNGSTPARLLLDTGATRGALASDFVERLGIATRDGGSIEGTAGVIEARAATVTIEVAGLGAAAVDVAVYPISSIDSHCVGLLGFDWLRRAPFRIRYARRALEWNAAPPASTEELRLDGGLPHVSAWVNGVELDVRLDTGASLPPSRESYVNLTQDQARRAGLGAKPAAVFTATGVGGATLQLPVFRLDSLRVVGADLPGAFAIVQPPVGYFARADAVGFLGNAVLDKLDPYVDAPRGEFGVGE